MPNPGRPQEMAQSCNTPKRIKADRHMQDLRLVGVADDGAHVLLVGTDGTRFRLPLDEALLAAVRRDRPRLGQLQIEVGGLRPREVQELIRTGLSTQEVADRSGWTVEKVRKFEVPVLAEREYVANLARAANPGRDSRTAATLEDRAHERLRQRGVPLDHLSWDSARVETGVWTVQLVFPAGGRERTAQWRFDPKARYLRAVNDDARWLSEDDDPEYGIPTPHVAASADPRDQVFDVEAEHRPGPTSVDELEDDLTDAVRAHSHAGRRKRRRAAPTAWSQEVRIETLPLETFDSAAAAAADDPPAPPVEESAPPAKSGGTKATRTKAAPPANPDPAPEMSDDPAPPDDDQDEQDPQDPQDPQTGATRRGRARVPSWDDIVFGTRARGQG